MEIFKKITEDKYALVTTFMHIVFVVTLFGVMNAYGAEGSYEFQTDVAGVLGKYKVVNEFASLGKLGLILIIFFSAVIGLLFTGFMVAMKQIAAAVFAFFGTSIVCGALTIAGQMLGHFNLSINI